MKKQRKWEKKRTRKQEKTREAAALHPHAQRAHDLIKMHDAVLDVNDGTVRLKNGGFRITFNITVSLPSKAKKRGFTETTGVKAIEPVVFDFPVSYPYKAPQIYLREDFNRSLPHIMPLGNPHDGFVAPCIYDGKLDDLLHTSGDGLCEIINRLSEWLGRAAIDDLIDPTQGWEPIRRDHTEGVIVYDLSGLRSLVRKDEGSAIFRCNFNKHPIIETEYFVWGIDINKPDKISPALVEKAQQKATLNNITIYNSLVFLCWADEEEGGHKKYIDKYMPETVASYQQLISRAQDYGCETSLRDLFVQLRMAIKEAEIKTALVTVFVVFAVRRPDEIIDDDSSLELIPYKCECKLEEERLSETASHLMIRDESEVFPIGHRFSLTSKLLQRMSGVENETNEGAIVSLGCGSVGSKICLHLARAGFGPHHLIDESFFSPHNAARHALTYNTIIPYVPKIFPLKDQIEGFRQKVDIAFGDIIPKCINGKNIFPDHSRLIIETTGSIAVREALAELPPERLPGRLLHAGLHEQGEVGFMAIEGADRNPKINDLVACFWDERIDNEKLHSKFSKDNSAMSRQNVGLGCGSHTMVMPDTRVSLFSAAFAERASQLLEKGAAEQGELWIGLLDECKLGVEWKKYFIGRATVVEASNGSGWEIRISSKAVQQIEREVQEYGPVETGGVLIGRISLLKKCIIISRVLEAPPDSDRSISEFILGVQGLKKRVLDIREHSGKTLTYVGTWHSHPGGGDASKVDKKSIAKVSKLRFGHPTLYLIWTPQGFKAIVKENLS